MFILRHLGHRELYLGLMIVLKIDILKEEQNLPIYFYWHHFYAKIW